ncbi:MAG: response regulator transcription factor [Synechococcales cyanobacterium]
MPERVPKILLVDDEPGVREAVQSYLEASDFQVVSAATAMQAMQQLQHWIPDLIVSDIMMPGMNGYQFLENLRQHEQWQRIPVIFLTAKGLTTDRIQGYRAGIDAYLSKPFDPDELVAIIHNLLHKLQSQSPTDAVAQELHALRDLITEKLTATPTPVALPTHPTPPIQIEFTPREQDILAKVSEGLMNKEIARQLNTSVRNVEKYITRLLAKTGTSSRTELVRYALTYGLVTLPQP